MSNDEKKMPIRYFILLNQLKLKSAHIFFWFLGYGVSDVMVQQWYQFNVICIAKIEKYLSFILEYSILKLLKL